jgi:hypothetical protein
LIGLAEQDALPLREQPMGPNADLDVEVEGGGDGAAGAGPKDEDTC